MPKLIIDTDPGVDDAHALMAALAHPQADVKAVTTVVGNVPLPQATRNACAVLEVMESEMPVYAGCEKALVAPPSHTSEFHGQDGLGGVEYQPSMMPVSDKHAVEALIGIPEGIEEDLTLLAIGPLTNIAVATMLDPTLPKKYQRLVIMGGAIHGMGNTTPAAEFNFFADPEAAYIVFREWSNLSLVSWETTVEHSFTPEQVRSLMDIDTSRGTFFRRITQGGLAFLKELTGEEQLFEPDLLAAAVAVDPGLVQKSEFHRVEIVLEGEKTRGLSTVDWYGLLGKEPNVELVLELDTQKVWEMIKVALE